jgi:ABC-type uncharacterized transport system ATPase subunit
MGTQMTDALQVIDLRARIGDLEILKGVDLSIPFGEVHAIMGPNGSGKSTLSHVLMGKADYDASGCTCGPVRGVPVPDGDPRCDPRRSHRGDGRESPR